MQGKRFLRTFSLSVAVLCGLQSLEYAYALPDAKFPSGSLGATESDVSGIDDKVRSKLSVGQGVNEKFGGSREKFSEHPWQGGALGGRDPVGSELDWLEDSLNIMAGGALSDANIDLKTFAECFEPRLIAPKCDYCMPDHVGPSSSDCDENNSGFIWEYWWPEIEIETNNFAISAINPVIHGKPQLHSRVLQEALKLLFDPIVRAKISTEHGVSASADFPGGLRDNPNLGQSHWAGILPHDQTQQVEGHVYRTKLAVDASDKKDITTGEWGIDWKRVWSFCVPGGIIFWNGYRKGAEDNCFYNTLEDPKPDIMGWTEEIQHMPFWRIPELSALIDQDYYKASVGLPAFVPGSPQGLIADARLPDPTQYYRSRSCSSFRITKWPDQYRDLTPALGMVPLASGNQLYDDLEKICYKGGGQLYPLVGNLSGHHSPLTSEAYLARRALELMIRQLPSDRAERPHKFSDKTDKLQRIYPLQNGKAGKCFKMNDIDDRDPRFPRDLIRPEHNGSIRHVYWNKRIACTCPYHGQFREGSFHLEGTGCQTYRGFLIDGLLNFETSESIAEGDKDDQEVEGILLPPGVNDPLINFIAAMGSYAEAAAKLYPFIGR